jgi:hypothetical protein
MLALRDFFEIADRPEVNDMLSTVGFLYALKQTLRTVLNMFKSRVLVHNSL